jgi:transglutaminase-like putative cysteine protease
VKRDVSAHLRLGLSAPATLIFSVAAARGVPVATESITITVDGEPVQALELIDVRGTRLHKLRTTGADLVFDYEASIEGTAAPAPVDEMDMVEYLRPSRYCESDTLLPTAASEFAGLEGSALLGAVSQWVNEKIAYVAGSSKGTDSALTTLLERQGVCRDFAHLTTALLRAREVPARTVAVYAPGLMPMEYHAVTEAFVEGSWQVVDATWLAPRTSLVRVATGRDAADTAFLTNYGGNVALNELEVTAVVDELPTDDWRSPAQLG